MKIDTTAAILQLSRALATVAGVADPSTTDIDPSQAQPGVTTNAATPGQPPASFLQLLAQVLQTGTDSTPTPTVPTENSVPSELPADETVSDPTAISTALMALLSQSNQLIPNPIPAVPVPQTAATPQSDQVVGAAAASVGDAIPTAAIGCPQAIIPASDLPSPPQVVQVGREGLQPIHVNYDTPQPTPNSAANAKSDVAAQVETTALSNMSDLIKPNVIQADQALATPVAAVQTITAPETIVSTVAPAITLNPLIDVKNADNKAQTSTVELNTQPATSETVVQNITDPIPPHILEKISETNSRHIRNEASQAAISSVGKDGHVGFSNPMNLASDAVLESSSEVAEPVKETAESPDIHDSLKSDVIEQSMSGESVHGAVELVAAVDPVSQGAAIDAHSLAHHLEEMVMQRLDKPESAGHASVVLRLDPPELGRVNVHLSVTNDIVSIRMVTSDDAARQVVERQLNELQKSLSDQGISFQEFQVQSGGSGQSSDRGLRQHWIDNSGYSAFNGRRVSNVVPTPQNRSGILAQLDYVA